MTEEEVFNRVSAAPPSKCCCCKTRDGVVIIGISILVFSLITTVTLSHNLALNSDQMYENFRLQSNDKDEIENIIRYVRCTIIISLLLALTTAFSSVALLWGMKKRRPDYLIPFIAVSIPSIAFNLISSFVFIIKVWNVTNKPACVTILVLVFGFYATWGYCVVVVVRYRKRNRRKTSYTEDAEPRRGQDSRRGDGFSGGATAAFSLGAPSHRMPPPPPLSAQNGLGLMRPPLSLCQSPHLQLSLPPYDQGAPPPYSPEPSAPLLHDITQWQQQQPPPGTPQHQTPTRQPLFQPIPNSPQHPPLGAHPVHNVTPIHASQQV